MNESIGIIAGSGQFPRLVAQDARASGYAVVMCGFFGHTDPELAVVADAFQCVHLGQFNKVIAIFREHGVRRLCMAGAISKPRALDIRPDLRAAKILFSLRGKGDDALLRAIMADLEAEGFAIMQASELSTSLRCPSGVLTKRHPTEEEWGVIEHGWPIAETMGRFDIGQCLVVKDGMVLAVECLEGTDATLRRGATLGGEGCIALKMAKPGQDERVDLPSIGLNTIELLLECKYSCLAIQAGKTLFFDRAAALELADKHGLCVVARE
ncbi:MAG: UDP-2,3-diacylglucosamine diphosphatase LpxI [Bilophila sp.]